MYRCKLLKSIIYLIYNFSDFHTRNSQITKIDVDVSCFIVLILYINKLNLINGKYKLGFISPILLREMVYKIALHLNER